MKPLCVVHYMRDPRQNTYSIERLYEDVRRALPQDIRSVVWTCHKPSRGILPRLRDAWSARSAQGDVNHVTGDTHYLTYFLDKQRTVLTVHDLVAVERSKGLKRFLFWFFWFWLPVMRVRLVITVSEATRQSLLRSVRCDPNKVVVVHNPVSEEFHRAPRNFDKSCPVILQVGTIQHKNIPRVAEALTGLKCKLFVIGPLTTDLKKILEFHKISYKNFVGLSREEMLERYIDSDILIFASTYEGFGLPIIEANTVGRPVIASNLSPMTEVANDAACLVNPFDVEEIKAGVMRILNDSQYREILIEAGYRNAERFHSVTVAENYAVIYRKVGR